MGGLSSSQKQIFSSINLLIAFVLSPTLLTLALNSHRVSEMIQTDIQSELNFTSKVVRMSYYKQTKN